MMWGTTKSLSKVVLAVKSDEGLAVSITLKFPQR
jgi:hypothetical protein